MHYNEFFNAWGLLLGGVYSLFFVLILWRLLSQQHFSQQDRIFFVVSFMLFVIVSFTNSYFDIFPYFPDTIRFAELVENNVVQSSSLGVRLYWFISTPLRLLSFQKIEVYIVFQCAMYFFSIILLWQGWLIHCKYKKILPGNFQILTLFALMYPAALAFITIPLREFIQIFGFSLFLFGLSNYVYQGKGLVLLLGALLTIFVRPQLVIVYPLLIVAVKQKNILKLVFYGLLVLPFAVLLFESLTGYQFSPSFFSYLRNAAGSHYGSSGMTYGLVNWKSYVDILFDLPLLFLQFLFSPLPILHHVNPFSLRLLLADLLFVCIVLFGAFSVKYQYSSNYIKMFFLLSIIFSIWEFYIGGAVRHRLPIIFMLLPLASLYYTNLINLLLAKEKAYANN